MKVTILIAGGDGKSSLLCKVCMAALLRHKNDTDTVIRVVCSCGEGQEEEGVMLNGVEYKLYAVPDPGLSGSAVHAALLDRAVQEVNTEMFMTLDVDCFPVADGWLDWLVNLIENRNVAVAGILHPYAPPGEGVPEGGIEWRIRSNLCWHHTHVACQLLRLDTFKKLGVKFSDGDDTGLAIPVAARKAGMEIGGFMPARCPFPDDPMEDPEMNRSECVIFGDMMYHHGGGLRENMDRGNPSGAYATTRKRVLDEGGAEFLLREPSHVYRMDREEDVADNMARGILAGMVEYLRTNDGALFRG